MPVSLLPHLGATCQATLEAELHTPAWSLLQAVQQEMFNPRTLFVFG
jgi:hypothetical protein